MTAEIPFEDCEKYDCGEAQVLTHEFPEEALDEALRELAEPPTESITVTGFVRMPWRKAVNAKSVVDSAIECVEEAFEEELAEPGRYSSFECFDGANRSEFRGKLEALITEYYDKAKAWACEPVVSRVYTPEELLPLWQGMNRRGR